MRGLSYSGISGEQQTRHWEKFESSKRFAFYSIHPCLMNRITQRYNFKLAMLDVMRNKGSAGVDRVNVNDLPKILTLHHHEIRRSMLDGTYKPDPVLRVVIPKGDGRCRLLGIPTALDRVIQKAIQDRLDDAWDHTFSPFSYGFRRMRSSRHAIMKAREYIKSGLTWIIDIDLENFFDTINHDLLMNMIRYRVRDDRVVTLISRYLRAGVVVDGRVEKPVRGTPQGGPLSPLLANLFLDELDYELERRGLRFVRYADDFAIFVDSEGMAQSVRDSIECFLTRKLKLKINRKKSGRTKRPWEFEYLGFTFTKANPHEVRVSPHGVERFRGRVEEILSVREGASASEVWSELKRYGDGWISQHFVGENFRQLADLAAWIGERYAENGP